MIRVLQVVTHMNRGGLETMIMNYYRNIDRKKVQFDFLVHRPYEADYDQEIKSLGGRIYHISHLVPWSVSYKKELKKFFYEHSEYKIVHVHQDCLSSVALQCAKECGIPVRIAHSHSSSQDKNIKYLIKLFYRQFIPKYATNLFACGTEAGDWMFLGNRFQVVRNAIDAEKYVYNEQQADEIRKEWGLTNKIVIGHVGRFNAVKNQKFLVDVLDECLKKDENVRLMMIGDGVERPMIEEKVRKMNLDKYAIFTGVRTDVAQLMQAMDVFAFPSLYEGLPVTLVEAQAAGIPCLISDQISKECILTKDLVSIMSLEDTPEKWADMILKCAEKKKMNQLSEIRESGYDIVMNAKKLQQFYLVNGEK